MATKSKVCRTRALGHSLTFMFNCQQQTLLACLILLRETPSSDKLHKMFGEDLFCILPGCQISMKKVILAKIYMFRIVMHEVIKLKYNSNCK